MEKVDKMNYRIVLGYVAFMSLFVAVLFAGNGLWDLLTGANNFDLKEMFFWLGGSVSVLAVSLALLGFDFILYLDKKGRD